MTVSKRDIEIRRLEISRRMNALGFRSGTSYYVVEAAFDRMNELVVEIGTHEFHRSEIVKKMKTGFRLMSPYDRVSVITDAYCEMNELVLMILRSMCDECK